MESVVALTNLLQKALSSSSQEQPDYDTIQLLLAAYQKERQERMRKIIDFSGLATKLQAWETPLYKIVSRMVPYLPDDTFAKQASALFKGAPKLDFIPVPGSIKGTMQWDDDAQAAALTKPLNSRMRFNKSNKLLMSVATPFLFVVAILLPLIMLVQGSLDLHQVVA